MLLKEIKVIVKKIEPEATVMLYGSRARVMAREDSDWDILILVPGEVNQNRKNFFRDLIYQIELKYNEVISMMIFSYDELNSPRNHVTSYYINVVSEAVRL